MTTFSRRALRGALSVLVLIVLAPATAQADSGGKLNFMKPAQSDFASYLNAPTSTQQAWMRDHYFRMRTYEPYFDSRLAWYPNAWSYEDAYAIYYGSEAGLESYILRDSAGNRLYIPFGCSGGTCPQYAADIGDPGWRARYINAAKGKVAKGYKGIFVDDVNFQMHVGNGNGTYVTPMDKRTGAPMTTDNWQRYFAEFMEELRAALPAEFEIVQNQVWFQGGGLSSAYVKRAIEASSHIEIERGVIDTGITGGGGQFGFETLLAWADYIHSRGKGVVWDAQSTWGREYQVATYYLVSNGLDSIGHPDGALPDSWWSGYDTDLGEPLGARYSWNGVLRRDFQNGFALVNQPGQTTKTLSLGGTFTRIGGSTASSVTLAAREGVVFRGATSPDPDPLPPPSDSIEKAADKPTSASSSHSLEYSPDKANDGSSSTRWSSTFADNQWWQVDLGSTRKVDSVRLSWEAAYAQNYKIQTSTDGSTFTDVASVSLTSPTVELTTFSPVSARYVRVLGITRATPYGFSFYEASVYGPEDTEDTSTPPPPPPPADTTAPDTSLSGGPTGKVVETTASFGLVSTESDSTFECRLDAAAWAACTSPENLSGLTVGKHTFEARARDAAGNVDASPATRTWSVVKRKNGSR